MGGRFEGEVARGSLANSRRWDLGGEIRGWRRDGGLMHVRGVDEAVWMAEGDVGTVGLFGLTEKAGVGMIIISRSAPTRGTAGWFGCWRSSTVEQLICNQQVAGSNPIASSR
jgi:hypothetical protein